jgi:PhnB protein
MKLNPYLFFNGNCEEAFKFYAELLRGKIEMMMPHRGSPAEGHVGPEWQDKIMHARLSFGDQTLMASDAPPGRGADAMKGFSVSVNVDSPAEAERIFRGLAEGGTVQMALEETFWAERFGMLVDRFGTPWMINCEKKEAA